MLVERRPPHVKQLRLSMLVEKQPLSNALLGTAYIA